MRATLIVNPAAGILGTGMQPEDLLAAVRAAGHDTDMLLTTLEETGERQGREAVARGAELVVAAGGDGTTRAVARALVGQPVLLGILPLGTANNLATSLGIPPDLDRALAYLRAPRVVAVDVGTVNGRPLFEAAGIGLDAALLPDLEAMQLGRWARATQTMRAFRRCTMPVMRVAIDDRPPVRFHSYLTVVSNTPFHGRTMTIAPKDSPWDGMLHVTVFPGFSKWDLIAYFLGVMEGHVVDDPRLLRFQARRVLITSARARTTHAYGGPLGRVPRRAEVAPGVLRVIVGEASGPAIQPPLRDDPREAASQHTGHVLPGRPSKAPSPLRSRAPCGRSAE